MEPKDSIEESTIPSLPGKAQLFSSKQVIDDLKRSGEESLSEVHVAVDRREVERREEEEKGRRSRLIRLQNEAIASSRANEEIEVKWDELSSLQIPQDLQREIDGQKEACEGIMASKDQLIQELHRLLREKDEEYVNNLRKQESEVQDLLERKRSEFRRLQKSLDEELLLVEAAYRKEREDLLASQRSELDFLLEKRGRDEVEFLEGRKRREEDYQEEMGLLMDEGTEKHNQLKIELESNIQALKEQLEEIRATYQLNTEKLDYNYRVLTELGLEKSVELGRYRKRVNKLRELVAQHKHRLRTLEKQSEEGSLELTNDHKSFTQKYKGLQQKFRQSEELDVKKFEDLWQMHDEEIRLLVDRVLAGDRIITEQVLGWGWQEPSFGPPPPVEEEREEEDGEEGRRVGELADTPSGLREQRVTAVKLRQMLGLLASQTDFLLDRHVQEALGRLEEGEQKESARMESVLEALNVESEEEVRLLMNYFFAKDKKKRRKKAKKKKKRAEEGGKGEEANNGGDDDDDDDDDEHEEDEEEIKARLKTLIISPEQVVQAVQAFLDEKELRRAEGGNVATSRKTAKRRKRVEDKWEAWEKLAGVLGEEKEEGLAQLEREMTKMTHMLDERKSLLGQVQAAQERNDQLRLALERYLTAPVNDDLVIPPTQTIRL